MEASGVPLSRIKERGHWASDCVYKYIKPSWQDYLAETTSYSLH